MLDKYTHSNLVYYKHIGDDETYDVHISQETEQPAQTKARDLKNKLNGSSDAVRHFTKNEQFFHFLSS